MSKVTALLHARHLPGAGVSHAVHFAGDVLVVEGSQQFEVPAESLDISTGGFDDDTLFVNWARADEQYSLVVTDPAAQQLLADTAPSPLRAAFGRSTRELRYQRRKWSAVVSVVGLVAAALIVGWWQSEAVIGWLAGKVPLEREERLGAMGLRQLQREATLRQDGAAAEAVAGIGSRLTQGSRYHYQWFVNDSAEINAFALPGGVVVVNSALIAATETPEELAGVLAHEVQHVEGRHALEQMIHSAGWAAILAVALGDVSALGGALIHQAGSLRHSRQLELEADAGGVENLARAGIAPQGVPQFFARMQAEQARTGGESVIALLSTHPATGDRLERATRLADAAHCQCRPLEYDWNAIRAALREPAAGSGSRGEADAPKAPDSGQQLAR